MVGGGVGQHHADAGVGHTVAGHQRLDERPGPVVVAGEAGAPQVGVELLVRLRVLGYEGGVEHQRAPVGVARAGVRLELADQHHREHLVVLGDGVTQRLFGLGRVVERLERPHDGHQSAPADAAVGVHLRGQRLDLRGGVALVGGVEAEGRLGGLQVDRHEGHPHLVVGDPGRGRCPVVRGHRAMNAGTGHRHQYDHRQPRASHGRSVLPEERAAPATRSSMPFIRSANHHVAALMAITGLPATARPRRPVAPWRGWCRTARWRRRPAPSTSRIADRSRSSVTWAMDTAVGQRSPSMAATSKPISVKNRPTLASPTAGRGDDADAAGTEQTERLLARLGAGGDPEAGDASIGPRTPCCRPCHPEGLGRHAHDHGVRFAGQHPFAGRADLGPDLFRSRSMPASSAMFSRDVDAAEVGGHAGTAMA